MKPVPDLRGIVLDLDGLLIDSEMWSWQAHNQALALFDAAPLSLHDVRRLIGFDADDEWAILRTMRPLLDDRGRYTEMQRAAFRALRDRSLAPMPGTHDLLAQVAARGLRLGLASNSPLRSINAALEGLGIRDRFAAIASADEVAYGKPAPDVYQLALGRLDVDPSQALAVEDSAIGLTAAHAAGLFCIAVPSELTAVQDFSRASLRMGSLRDVAAWLQQEG